MFVGRVIPLPILCDLARGSFRALSKRLALPTALLRVDTGTGVSIFWCLGSTAVKAPSFGNAISA